MLIVTVVQGEKLTISKNRVELFRESEASVLVKIALGMKKAAWAYRAWYPHSSLHLAVTEGHALFPEDLKSITLRLR